MMTVLPLLRRALSSGALFVAAAGSTISPAAAADPFVTSYRHDGMGRVVGVISPDPDGAGALPRPAVRNTYDLAGRLVQVERGHLPEWQSADVVPANWSNFVVDEVTVITLNALDQKLRESVSGRNPSTGVLETTSVAQYSWDSHGRPECSAVRLNPASFANLPTSACTLGSQGAFGADRITRNLYDGAGQLLTVQRGVGTALQQDYARYTWSPTGKRTSVIDANGNRATMSYDGHDRQTHWFFPHPSATGQTSTADYEAYSYDANGNRLTLRKRDGRTIAFSYDALDRMVSKTYPNGGARPVYYAYDLRGLQTRARFDHFDGEGVTNAYDGFGEPVAQTLAMDGVSRTLTRTYDANGNRVQLQFPDGLVSAAAWDGLDRITAIGPPGAGAFVSFAYNGVGQLAGMGRYNWAITGLNYDSAGRLWARGDNLVGTAHDLTVFLGYNPAGQIVSRSRDNVAYSFAAYAPAMRAHTVNGLNQYLSAGGLAFSYDANGNLTGDGSVGYAYDIENRLVQAWGAKTAALRYDPLGRLYEVTGGGPTTRFLWDGDELVAEYDGAGALLRRYAHGGGDGVDDPLVWHEGTSTGAPRMLHTDHQGSVIAASDATGAAIALNRYDEYGIPASTNQGRFGYTGQAWIPELGLWHYKARFYSPTLGRFLQTDPIGYEDQVNLYAYVGNDPVNKVDPSGKDTVVTLEGYPLGTYPIVGGTFGHSYVRVTDTVTGESYTFRGGPSAEIGTSAAVSNSAANDSRGRTVTLTARVDPASRNPDTERGGYADQAGGAETIRSANLGDRPIGSVVKTLEGVRDSVNGQQAPYRAQSHNSNTAAGAAFTSATGQAVTPTSKYPGIANPLTPEASQKPVYDRCISHPGSC